MLSGSAATAIESIILSVAVFMTITFFPPYQQETYALLPDSTIASEECPMFIDPETELFERFIIAREFEYKLLTYAFSLFRTSMFLGELSPVIVFNEVRVLLSTTSIFPELLITIKPLFPEITIEFGTSPSGRPFASENRSL